MPMLLKLRHITLTYNFIQVYMDLKVFPNPTCVLLRWNEELFWFGMIDFGCHYIGKMKLKKLKFNDILYDIFWEFPWIMAIMIVHDSYGFVLSMCQPCLAWN